VLSAPETRRPAGFEHLMVGAPSGYEASAVAASGACEAAQRVAESSAERRAKVLRQVERFTSYQGYPVAAKGKRSLPILRELQAIPPDRR
jgi:hypothetical protein